MNLQNLTNTELIDKTKLLAQDERDAKVDLLIHLAEVDSRKLYLELGYPSMFEFLVRGLKFSSSAAGRRTKAIRVLANNTKAQEMLRDGSLSLTSLNTASVAIKEDSESLDRFKGVSSREAELIASEYREAPKRKIKDKIKPLGRKKAIKAELPLLEASCPGAGSREIKDLAPVQHEVRFQASQEFTEKLEQAKKLLSGKFPAGLSLEQVLGECIDIFLEKKCPLRRDKRRKVRAAKLKKEPQVLVSKTKSSRHVPAAIRDKVYIRDKGQCTYESPDGTRCCSKHDLEVDHVIPFSVCQSHEPENLRLLCRKHNMLMAEQAFGADYIQHQIEWQKGLLP